MTHRFAILFALLVCLSIAPDAGAESKNIWMSACEVAARDTAGAFSGAWTNIRRHAAGVPVGSDSSYIWQPPNMKVQNAVNINNPSKLVDANTGAKAVAAAIYYLKTGNTVFRDKVKDAVVSAMASLDDSSEWNLPAKAAPGNPTMYSLAPGRQLKGYVIAADLIDLATHYASTHTAFAAWLDTVPRAQMNGAGINQSVGNSIVRMAESGAQGDGQEAMGSWLAASLYINKTADVVRAESLFKAMTNRSLYPANAYVPPGSPTGTGYFVRSVTRPHKSWLCGDDTLTWTAISASCDRTMPAGTDSALGVWDSSGTKLYCRSKYGLTTVAKTVNISGALVRDICRQCKSTCAGQPSDPNGDCYPHDEVGVFRTLPDSVGTLYSWGTVGDLFTTAEMLYRAGKADVFTYGTNGIKRALDFLYGYNPSPTFQGGPNRTYWIANYRYGSSFPSNSLGRPDESFGYTDWTHRQSSPPVTGLTATSSASGLSVTIKWGSPGNATQSYDARFSNAGHVTSANFDNQSLFSGEPTPSKTCGAIDSMVVETCPATVYHIAVRPSYSWGVGSVSGDVDVTTSGTLDPTCGIGSELRGGGEESGVGQSISENPTPSFYTVSQARSLNGMVWFDLTGRQTKVLRSGVYWVQVGKRTETRRMVVVR